VAGAVAVLAGFAAVGVAGCWPGDNAAASSAAGTIFRSIEVNITAPL
jgi:hypothetical protein